MIGANVSLGLATAAKALAAKGPLADKELRALRTQALGDETINPDERIFLTGLTDESNAKLLAATRVADGVKLRFGFAPGATTRRIADLDRPVPDAAVRTAEAAAVEAVWAGDIGALLTHADAAGKAIERQLVRIAGRDRRRQARARSVMAFALREGVAASVLDAAIAAASDATPDDLLAAASAYAIARAAGHPMAVELLAGRVKVDVRRTPGAAGGYNPIARPGAKGDTLALPHVPDPDNLDDRGTVIHELQHAAQDAGLKPSPLRQLREPKDLEQEAYTVEADYELKELAKLSDARARATAVGQLVKTWGDVRAGAMAVATKQDPSHLPLAQELSKAVRKVNAKSADRFDALLAGDAATAIRWLRSKAPAGAITELDGLSGETDLDRSATFSAGRPAVSRRVVTSDGVRSARFQVGVELTPALARAAWEATVAGPLDEAGLRKLRAVALSHWSSTIDDDERMFMAALMDAGNARTLHVEHPFGLFADASVSFAANSITAANRRAVEDVGRFDRPADRSDPDAPHVEGDTRELDRQIREMAGAFSYVADAALKLADKVGVSHAGVYFAMLGGASDSTPDDRAYAAATYVIGVQAGLDVAGDIPPGRLKVDAVPRHYLALVDADAEGAYYARGGTMKGDTLYLPWDTDPERLDDRATIVHELKHASTDKEQASITNAQDELRSFETQMRYVVAEVQPLTGAARTRAISEAATGYGQLEILAALGAIRDDSDPPDPDSLKVVEELNAAVANNLPDLAPYLRMRIGDLYDASLKTVAKRYAKRKPHARSRTDGFRGASALD